MGVKRRPRRLGIGLPTALSVALDDLTGFGNGGRRGRRLR
ncbi:hypothetical protein EDD27_2878 [Nonomuraea polychroma]|uniref:Uncharacterized protein n=1 Tax=Nonomuraea polychroma TaxID=46176 RepID=A0A438M4U6_9ACTN|nr:hypothetical protein EDD27_2878 [Nonomuraea polychroma]